MAAQSLADVACGGVCAIFSKPVIGEGDVVRHLSPVFRERADYIIMARLEDDLPRKWEQLWAKELGNGRFEICCIPFAVYNLNLGDQVERDEYAVIRDVILPSGHFTFRAWFSDERSEDELEVIRDDVLRCVSEQLGCLVEWYSAHLFAIDAPVEDKAPAGRRFPV
jgi:hypothetical protein